MRVLIINVCCGTGSTGRICTDLAVSLEKQGHEVKIAYGRDEVPEEYKKYAFRFNTKFGVLVDVLKTRMFDSAGFNSRKETKKFLLWVDDYNPDLIWLHNLHGYYINIELLFNYIKNNNKNVIWTLHDCWAFTGHCPYFSYVNCNKWQKECNNCPQKHNYPERLWIDASRKNYIKKKQLFLGVQNMQLITPSKWLAGLVKKSFLSEYPVKVIYNTIDKNIFRYTPGDFRKSNGLEDKKIILAVAGVWDQRKGLQDVLKLRRLLSDKYCIVIVGLTKKQISTINNIYGETQLFLIERTNNAYELAALYSTADVFINTTYEDNYPTTNLEAQACGTPCITYRTGGSVESVPECNVVNQGDIEALRKRIEEICNHPNNGTDPTYL